LELQLIPLLAWNPLDPIVSALHVLLTSIDHVLHSYGWSVIVLALIVKACFWPLNTLQFKAMLKTQALAPQIKALQARHKNDKEKLNQETMALYKESGANPLMGCLPILLQMPILISLYMAINTDRDLFKLSSWLWIGTPLSKQVPNHILAGNLSQPDMVLLVLYVLSMYFSIRFTSPAMDEQQAQQQRIMAFISPAMVGFFGLKYQWPSALILYWLAFNVFSMGQQFYLINKYHRNPAAIGPHPEKTVTPVAIEDGGNGKSGAASATGVATNGAPGSRSRRRRRGSRR
jgi:YidC/Oxa1 family membrane protein insertase